MKITKIIYQNIESCLRELSDLEFQKRVWLRGEGPEVSSFVEVVCQLFDDTGIGDELNEKTDGFVTSEELDPILRELGALIDSIDYRVPVIEILKHPNWQKVLMLSSHALTKMTSIKIYNKGELE